MLPKNEPREGFDQYARRFKTHILGGRFRDTLSYTYYCCQISYRCPSPSCNEAYFDTAITSITTEI